MQCLKRKAVVNLCSAIALGVSVTAVAQDTSSALRGVVSTQAGDSVAGASIVLRDERTGDIRTYSTNEQGAFSAQGLGVGGPYTLIATGPNGRRDIVENLYLTLGDSESIEITVEPIMETLEVTSEANAHELYGNTSPAANFNLQDLKTKPAINRDLKDLIRTDPRVYIERSNGNAIQCNGANPRYNSLTVDGVRLNDNFGLNSNGYPTQKMGFSYDAIEQVTVEFAPFDVQYGGFTACNINAVTKSGTDQWQGSLLYDYTSDSLRGDSLEGVSLDQGDYDEQRYGLTLGGPLIADKLFIFAAYETLDGVSSFNRGAADSNAGTPVLGVSQAQLDEIAQIAQEVYGYDVGAPITSAPLEDEKLLVKLNWTINQDHHAWFTYNWNDGESLRNSDGDTNEYEFANHRYQRGTELTSYVGQLFSDWTDTFSTEIRAGHAKVENRQETIGPKDFGDFQIVTLNDANGDGVNSRATVYLGADDSRQANELSYDTTFVKLRGIYFAGDHVISGGYEREEVDIYNLFVQHARGGEYDVTGIDNFRQGIIDRLYYGSGLGSNNPRDAAAKFDYAVNTAYLQDEYYRAREGLTITAGLRYDWYTTSDHPALNEKFQQRYGFANTSTLDGRSLLQPRLGFNWVASPRLELRGGVGLFSGGNPNVWMANHYQNDGISQGQYSLKNVDLFDTELMGAGRPGYDVPESLYMRVAHGERDSEVNVLDPNFDIPSEWKYALGATYTLADDYILHVDFMYINRQDEPIIRNLAVEPARTLADGRILYQPVNDGRDEDLMLTNSHYDSNVTTASLALTKSYDFGLDVSLAYARVDAEDSHPMTSSVAYSNYTGVAVSQANDPRPATSNYEIPHRFTFEADYSQEFFDGLETTFSLVASANKGRPYSYTYVDKSIGGADIGRDRQLIYVPTGSDDPNVVFGPNFNQAAFFDFVEQSGLGKFAGSIAPRNAFYSQWWHKVDLKIKQELPGFMEGHKANVFFVIDNLTNLLNDDWGVLYQASSPQFQAVIDANYDSQGRYQYNEFYQPSGQGRVTDASLWQARIGVEYKF